MNIGSKINRLRKDASMTQEQLANAVGVSVPAVSKWENGGSMPDIAILAPLARLFKTDINDLLGYQEGLSDTEVDAKLKVLKTNFEKKGFDYGHQQAVALVKEFPGNNYLKANVASMIHAYSHESDKTQDEIASIQATCMDWMLEVFDHPKEEDHAIVHQVALSFLTMNYMKAKDYEKAEMLLKQLPDDDRNKSSMLAQVYIKQKAYDKAKKIVQKQCMPDFIHMLDIIQTLYEVAKHDGNMESAKQLAQDYYTVSNIMGFKAYFPSKYLFELALEEGTKTEALKYFNQIVDEAEQATIKPPINVYTDSIHQEIKTWRSDENLDFKTTLFRVLNENETFKKFSEDAKVKERLKELAAHVEEGV